MYLREKTTQQRRQREKNSVHNLPKYPHNSGRQVPNTVEGPSGTTFAAEGH